MTLAFASCEDVVQIDLDTAPPRLVVEADIAWIKGTDGAVQQIKLSSSTDFYATDVPRILNATVWIEDADANRYDFILSDNLGTYQCTNFNPVVDGRYTLYINHEGNLYTATDKLYKTPEIQEVEQEDEAGFTGEDIQLKFYFQDDAEQENSYVFKYNLLGKNYFKVADDEFFNGNQMYFLILDEDIRTSDTIAVKLSGCSTANYNYLNKILEVSSNSGNPFAAPIGVIRGNIINNTDPKNFPFGYFRLFQEEQLNYIVR